MHYLRQAPAHISSYLNSPTTTQQRHYEPRLQFSTSIRDVWPIRLKKGNRPSARVAKHFRRQEIKGLAHKRKQVAHDGTDYHYLPLWRACRRTTCEEVSGNKGRWLSVAGAMRIVNKAPYHHQSCNDDAELRLMNARTIVFSWVWSLISRRGGCMVLEWTVGHNWRESNLLIISFLQYYFSLFVIIIVCSLYDVHWRTRSFWCFPFFPK